MIDKIKIEVLKDFIQSGNINFLIGSGLSRPFLPVLGNIEKQMASVKDAPTNKQDALVAVLYKEYFEKVILPNFKPDYRSKIIHLHIRNIVKRALKTNPTLMVFIFSYQDSGKKRYLELFGENNSNLLSASYLQCPHCQLQLNIDRKRSIHALQALEKVEAARRDVEQKSKFYR